ncbi:stage II sporulation protein Q [Clostridium acetireducens DSM 10703]|jgi:murein DD-endopeptidase MepM/ murein hydrolase activator NlpD|uniref:Stage II sporulation protein Q n=1 Tax=Clostridium acetireducens DSM 10703 TaxID=1121290 RepID=A0A1E8EWN5_9CLOT|nr:M23 family metallopeptidase [Clostridium acetireducens]OFI01408.1 stage II sporulation protein Q [Clostridium acetireducens DSM 10703]
MDNKNNKSNFFKKEGFYVILFVCLCVVATIAVITTKNSRHAKRNIPVKQEVVSKNESKKDIAQEPSVDYQNALQVKENNKNSNNEKVSTEVSASTDMNFIKPVEGKLARGYSEQPVYWKSTDSYRANLGIDIKCELGAAVVASMDGVVEQINKNTEDGIQIILKHPNGLKTVYSNLDPKVKVAQGNKVKKGDQIGIVGKTTLRSAYETYGEHLHFEVLKGNVRVDPTRYIKY